MYDYLLPTFGGLVGTSLLLLAGTATAILKTRNKPKELKKCLTILALNGLIFLFVFYQFAPSMEFWLPLLLGKGSYTVSGEISEVQPLSGFPYYYDKQNKEFTSGATLKLGDTSYFILSAEALNTGDPVTLTVCEEGITVLSWEPGMYAVASLTQAPQEKENKSSGVLSIVTGSFILIMGCFVIAEELGHERWRRYLDANDTHSSHTLRLRPLSVWLQGGIGTLLLASAVVLGCCGEVTGLIFGIGAVFFLVPTFSLAATRISYDHNALTIRRFGRTREIPLSLMRSVTCGVSTVKGKWVKLSFTARNELTFVQMDYCGLDEMYRYFKKRKDQN